MQSVATSAGKLHGRVYPFAEIGLDNIHTGFEKRFDKPVLIPSDSFRPGKVNGCRFVLPAKREGYLAAGKQVLVAGFFPWGSSLQDIGLLP